MKRNLLMLVTALLMGYLMPVKAQIIKSEDLEKYAKSKYGDKWLDAAAVIAKGVSFDKNNNLSYQQVIEAPNKTKAQLYVTMNYWTTATFKDKQSITLNDKETGTIIITATMQNIATHTGGLSQYSVSITPIIKIDIKDGKVRVTYTVQNYDILADKSGGWLSFNDDNRTYGDSKRKQEDKTNENLYDEEWLITQHYPFVEKDAQKRTCAKALVMTHAYSNAVLDKITEAVKNGLVGNEDDDW